MDENINIVSDFNLRSIHQLIFIANEDNRSQISTVPSEIFEQLQNLEIFQLHATVEVLNKGDFEKAEKLKHITIDNQLKAIAAGVLGSAKNLESLFLSNNQIAEIEDNAFSGLNELFYISLENNNLTIIKQNTFNGLEKLVTLYLESNQIETIEENALNLPNLKELYLPHNKLTSLPDNLFSATPLLKKIYVQTNQINHIGKSFLKKLEILWLSHNKLTDADLVAFSQSPVLSHLDLDKNGLTSEIFSKIEFKETSNSILSSLSLVDNKLTNNEDWKKLAIFPQLEFINLQGNKYSKIDLGDKALRQQFPKLETVSVSSGDWNCDG